MRHIKKIKHDGRDINISCDDDGWVYVGDRKARIMIDLDGSTFVRGGLCDGLPSHTKIKLDVNDHKLIEGQTWLKDFDNFLKREAL